MPTLYIVRGLPGSGKSTRAREIMSETGAILIEPDQMLTTSGKYRYTPERYAAAVERCNVILELLTGGEFDVEGAVLRPDIIYADVLPTAREVFALLGHICGSDYKIRMETIGKDLDECRNIHHVDPRDLVRFRRIFEQVECQDGKVLSRGRYFPRTRTEETEGTDGTEGAGTEAAARNTGAVGAGTGSDGRIRRKSRKDGDHGE